eukprot:TRINITY_DN45_c1_g2_i1.p1 TRINITY_DN45_c1_g2~~TRINITY_DN45_c1_g2_i1.p1  ORF type:complete len:1078 (+),score=455.39 TRINITY_DN45_c1_g2_i1:166-3399(+)
MSSHDPDPDAAMEQILSLMQAKDDIIEELEKENQGYEEELKVLSTEFRKQLSKMDSLAKELKEARRGQHGVGATDSPLVEHMERQRSTLEKQREELEMKQKRVLELEGEYQDVLIKSNRIEKALSRCGALNRSFLRQLDAQNGLTDPEKDAIRKLFKEEESQRDQDLSETLPKMLEIVFGDQLLLLRRHADEKESLKVEIQNLQKQLDTATTSIETLSESGKLRHGIAEELSRRVRTAESENKRYKEDIERMKRREEGLKKRLAEVEKDVETAQMEAAGFRDQVAQSQAKYAEEALKWKREMGENERRRGLLVSDLKSLKEERDSFAKRLIEINEEYAAKETENEELRNALRESERQKTTISADYGTTSDELDYAKKVQTALEKERDEWKSDSEEKEKVLSALRSENAQLQYAVESMEHDLEEYQNLSRTSKEQIENFASMIEKFQDQMAEKDERAEKLKEELQRTREDARKQLTGLRQELDDALGMKQKSAEEIRAIVDSQDRLSEDLEVMGKERDEAKRRVEELSTELESMSLRLKEAEEAISKAHDTLERSNDECETLRSEIEKLKKDVQSAKAREREKARSFERANENYSKLKQETDKKIAEQQGKIDDLVVDNREMLRKMDSMKKENTALKEENGKVSHRLKQIVESSGDAEEEKARREAEIEELQTMCESLRSEKSSLQSDLELANETIQDIHGQLVDAKHAIRSSREKVGMCDTMVDLLAADIRHDMIVERSGNDASNTEQAPEESKERESDVEASDEIVQDHVQDDDRDDIRDAKGEGKEEEGEEQQEEEEEISRETVLAVLDSMTLQEIVDRMCYHLNGLAHDKIVLTEIREELDVRVESLSTNVAGVHLSEAKKDEQIEDLRLKILSLERSLEDANEAKEVGEHEVEEMRGIVATSQHQRELLSGEYQAMSEERDELLVRVNDLERQMQHAKSQLADLGAKEKRIQSLEDDLRGCREKALERDTLHEQLVSSRSRCRDLESELKEVKKQCSTLEERLVSVLKEFEQHEEQLRREEEEEEEEDGEGGGVDAFGDGSGLEEEEERDVLADLDADADADIEDNAGKQQQE